MCNSVFKTCPFLFLIAQHGTHAIKQLNPRNKEQVKNARKEMNLEKRISTCDITAAMAMQRAHFSNFIRSIRSDPDIQIFCGLGQAFHLANRIFKRSVKGDKYRQLICYDTTFNVGQHYLSTLLAQNIETVGDKLFPIAFFVFDKMKLSVNENIPIVTDRERAITNVLKSRPETKDNHFCCTNHILSNVKDYAKAQ